MPCKEIPLFTRCPSKKAARKTMSMSTRNFPVTEFVLGRTTCPALPEQRTCLLNGKFAAMRDVESCLEGRIGQLSDAKCHKIHQRELSRLKRASLASLFSAPPPAVLALLLGRFFPPPYVPIHSLPSSFTPVGVIPPPQAPPL